MNDLYPTNKDIIDKLEEHTRLDDKRFAGLATKEDVDSMRESVNARLTKQDNVLLPMLEILNGLGSGRKFVVWVIPILIFIGMVITFIRKV